MVYLGVDLHRKVSHLVALDDAGQVILSRRLANNPAEFRRVFGELEPEPIEAVFEATYGWSWFADLLADAGIAAHMAHPLATRAIAAGRVKNDAIDARTLAHLLRTNLLPEAPIAPPDVRAARWLVRMRTSLMHMRSRLKCQVHAICADLGLPIAVSDLFGPRGRELLASPALPVLAAGRPAANLRLIDALAAEIRLADREIIRHFRADPRIRRLTPIPGIGFLTAAMIVAKGRGRRSLRDARAALFVGRADPHRAQLCRSHAARPHQQTGHRWLRPVLVEAAVTASRGPSLAGFFGPIRERRGTKIARVALARRLLTLAFYALRDEAGCRAYPVLARPSCSTRARSPYGMASSDGPRDDARAAVLPQRSRRCAMPTCDHEAAAAGEPGTGGMG